MGTFGYNRTLRLQWVVNTSALDVQAKFIGVNIPQQSLPNNSARHCVHGKQFTRSSYNEDQFMQAKTIAFKRSVVASDSITTNEIDLACHELLGNYQELPKL
jgi:hypothetical protein